MNEKQISKIAGELIWPDVKKAFDNDAIVVFPLGAGCKEHGFHMPNNIDQIQAEYFASRIAEDHNVIIMPTITYSRFPAFVDYAGSTSLDTELCVAQYVSMCQQLHQQGAKAFYFINCGVSTTVALKETQEKLEEQDILMRFTDFFEVDLKDIEQQEGGTHADEIETSVMLYIKPEVVDMSQAKKDFDNKPGKLSLTPPKPGEDSAYSPTGVWGDPTLATVEKGKIIVERSVQLVSNDLLSLREKMNQLEENPRHAGSRLF